MKSPTTMLVLGLGAAALAGLAACGRHQSEDRRPATGSGGGPLLAAGGNTAAPTQTICAAREMVLTGTLDNARRSVRVATSGGGVIDGAAANAATKAAATPTTIQVTFANGTGDLRFEIDEPLVLGRQTAARAKLRLQDGSSLAVGNCVGQAVASRLWLTKRDGSTVEGSFVLQNLADSSKADCASAAKTGSLVGCFTF